MLKNTVLLLGTYFALGSISASAQDFQQLMNQANSLPIDPATSGSFTFGNMMGGFIFGAIGFVAFVYGKKGSLMRPMVLGALLVAFPMFVHSTWLLYGIGTALTAALYFWRG